MDNNIFQTVYDSLEAGTNEVAKVIAMRDKLEAKVKEGRYSQKALSEDIYPEINKLRSEVNAKASSTIDGAKALVAKYVEDVEHLDDLDPALITDDIKLLTAGVPLLERDIMAILTRNKGNRTMTQLALRYADEHGIKTGTSYIGGLKEKEAASNLNGIIDTYARWIDKDNALKMLNKFFGVE